MIIIDCQKLQQIGGMNEDLFIDSVDFEGCWRANYNGYKILCIPQLKIEHHLGEGVVRIASKKIPGHNYIRNYYITRNTLYLALYSKYLGRIMKCQLLFKSFLYPIGYTVLCKPHLKNAFYTLKGLFDGLFRRLGKLC